MMEEYEKEAVTFLKIELEMFIKAFPDTKVRYEYDIDAKVHTVEVLPQKIYNSNEEYIQWENDLTSRFINQFPYQNIGFISEDSLLGITDPIFARTGSDYLFNIYSKELISRDYKNILEFLDSENTLKASTETIFLSLTNSFDFNDLIIKGFEEFLNQFDSSLSNRPKDIIKVNDTEGIKFNFNDEQILNIVPNTQSQISFSDVSYSNIDVNNYPIAA